MAQLLLINATSKNDNNNLGDIVAIFEDDHVFSPAEISGFDIHKVNETHAQVVSSLESIKTALGEAVNDPKHQFAVKNTTDNTIATIGKTNYTK